MISISALRPRSGWSSSQWIAVCSVPFCAILVVATLASPGVAIAVVGVVASIAALRWSFLGLLAQLLFTFCGLVLVMVGVDTGVASGAIYVLLIISAVGVFSRRDVTKTIVGMAAIAVAVSIALMYASISLPIAQALQGLRLVSTPILVAVAVWGLNATGRIWLFKLCTILMAFTVVAAVYQASAGAPALVEAGLEAGTTVRTFDGQLRAPGLFLTNYEMGATAGVLAAIALVWFRRVAITIGNRCWLAASLIVSGAALVLSLYRTGMVFVAVTVLLVLILDRSAGRIERALALSACVGVATVLFLQSTLTSTYSLEDRAGVWERILGMPDIGLFGKGIGASGAASVSRFAIEPIITDNYFLSLWVQFGLLWWVLPAILLVMSLQRLRNQSAGWMALTGSLLVSLIATFFFVDYWEYSVAAGLALAFGAGAIDAPPLPRQAISRSIAMRFESS